MKKIIVFLTIALSVAIVSCDPAEERHSPGGAVTMADIDRYVTVTVEPALSGRPGNTIRYSSDGINALSKFLHLVEKTDEDGKIVTDDKGNPILDTIQSYSRTNGTMTVYFKGDHIIRYEALGADGILVDKIFNITVEELEGIDDIVRLFGDRGRKSWTWDDTRIPRSPDEALNTLSEDSYFPGDGTVFGLGHYGRDRYPRLRIDASRLTAMSAALGVDLGDYRYGSVLKPLPAGYLPDNYSNPILSSNHTFPANEGVAVDAGGAVTNMARMAFNLRTGTFNMTKHRLSGNPVSANLTMNMAESARIHEVDDNGRPDASRPVWSWGNIVLTGQAVLNGGNHADFRTLQILKLTEDELVVAVRTGRYQVPPAGSLAWEAPATAIQPYTTFKVNGDGIGVFQVLAEEPNFAYIWVFKSYTP